MTAHGALLAVILLEAAVVPLVAAVYAALPRRTPGAGAAARVLRFLPPLEALACLAAGLVAGIAVAALWDAAAPRVELARGAALGSVYAGLLAALAAGLARAFVRAGARGPLAATLAAAAPAALFAWIFVADPVLALLGTPDAAVAWTLRLSPVAALAGSFLGVDILRTAPLYGLASFASDRPFAYAEPAAALFAALVPAALAALGGGMAAGMPRENAVAPAAAPAPQTRTS